MWCKRNFVYWFRVISGNKDFCAQHLRRGLINFIRTKFETVILMTVSVVNFKFILELEYNFKHWAWLISCGQFPNIKTMLPISANLNKNEINDLSPLNVIFVFSCCGQWSTINYFESNIICRWRIISQKF